MAKNRRSKRAPARAGVKRAKAATKRKRVVALKQPEAVMPVQDTGPRSDAPARPNAVFPVALRSAALVDAARRRAERNVTTRGPGAFSGESLPPT